LATVNARMLNASKIISTCLANMMIYNVGKPKLGYQTASGMIGTAG